MPAEIKAEEPVAAAAAIVPSPAPSEEEPQIKNECHVTLERCSMPPTLDDPLDISQNSSCDYNMSQFKSNEESFHIKAEARESTSEDEAPLSKRKKPMVESDEDEEEKPLNVRKKVKEEVKHKKIESDEEDVPLIARKKIKHESDEEEMPLAMRAKKKGDKKAGKKKKMESEEESEDEKPKKKKVKKEKRVRLSQILINFFI